MPVLGAGGEGLSTRIVAGVVISLTSGVPVQIANFNINANNPEAGAIVFVVSELLLFAAGFLGLAIWPSTPRRNKQK